MIHGAFSAGCLPTHSLILTLHGKSTGPGASCAAFCTSLKLRHSSICHQYAVAAAHTGSVEGDSPSPSFHVRARDRGRRARGSSTLRGYASTGSPLDVADACVTPVYRSRPRLDPNDVARDGVRVLFLSEGNVCRSVIAEAVLRDLVREQGLGDDVIACESKAVRGYNVGEAPDPLVLSAAGQFGVQVDAFHRARLFQPAEDIVDFDLVVVMDKFNAADALKEVSVFDTIDPSAGYSKKVRRLGSFCRVRAVEDIDDPLYGNMGGTEELVQLSDAISGIQESCQGLLEDILRLRREATEQGGSLRQSLMSWVRSMDEMDWLVPPMLQRREQP